MVSGRTRDDLALHRRTSNHRTWKIPFILITGRNGDGKTTLLLTATCELVRHDIGIVLLHKDDRAILGVDQIEAISPDPTLI